MVYKDLPLNINAEPLTDKDAVKQAIYNILHIKKGEMPGKPDFGCPIDNFVFEPMDSTMKSLLLGGLNSALNQYEPRIQVQDISIEFQEAYNRTDIEVQYSYTGVKTSEYDTLSFSI